jgi:septal ring factor EnvC (AmiA/AmiB activator)
MTINGLWRFGYYKIFSGKSMEDIPIGFAVKIGDREILPPVGKRDTDSNMSQGASKSDIPEHISSVESNSIAMRVFNPMSTVSYDDSLPNQEEKVNSTSQDRMRIAALETMLSETQSKLSNTESKLSETQLQMSETQSKLLETESKLSETVSKLSETQSVLTEVLQFKSETSVMLSECLNRLAQLEKSG